MTLQCGMHCVRNYRRAIVLKGGSKNVFGRRGYFFPYFSRTSCTKSYQTAKFVNIQFLIQKSQSITIHDYSFFPFFLLKIYARITPPLDPPLVELCVIAPHWKHWNDCNFPLWFYFINNTSRDIPFNTM